MKRLVSAVLATLFGAQIATAQQTINGRITDGEAQPVEFANIILMAADSAFLGGTVSDLEGRFTLAQPANAHYISIS
ncbi:MAG: carboxypeptidase regulatory-like domain-containing protein, partial [Salinivirgaceae bacterium]|nr:carboxypeptidase regulatory-like domain-containing protein [Salinivirgaceae bacterium]